MDKQSLKCTLDIGKLLKAGKEHSIGTKLDKERFLASVAMAANKLISEPVLVPRRRIRNDRDKLHLSDGTYQHTHNVYFVMQVGDELFDEHGPTSWDQQQEQHNKTQQTPVQWDGSPMNGGEHFADILQGAGSCLHLMFELRDHLLALGQSQLLDKATPTSKGMTHTRRM